MTISNRNIFLLKTYIFFFFLAYVNNFYIENFLDNRGLNFKNGKMRLNGCIMMKLLIFEKLFVIS